MENQNVFPLFEKFNKKYFWNKLTKVKVSWSPQMTLCAGKTAFKVWKNGWTSCSIRLSQPLLSQRPHHDTVNTLLHEMIHAYLHVTQGLQYRDSHGPEFRSHMKRINAEEGSKITIFHNFEKEVDKFRVHVYRCDGPCVKRRPYFGILKRAIERPPGPTDRWWARHQQECGGTFHKIEGPGAKPSPENDKSGKQIDKYRIPNNLNRTPEKPSALIDSIMNDMDNSKYKLSSNPSISSEISTNYNSNSYHNSSGAKKRRSRCVDKKRSFNEAAVLERIRDKYSNIKQTKLLSKETAEQLIRSQLDRSGFGNDGPRDQDGKPIYRYSAKVDNYVEGRMNYSYQSLSPKQIKLDKYLRRFYEASNSSEPFPHSSRESSSVSSKDSVVSQEASLLRKDSSLNSEYQNISNQNTFNYDYQSRTPDMINLEKYIKRYRNYSEKFLPTSRDSQMHVKNVSKSTGNSSSCEKSSLPKPQSPETTQCPICSIRINPKDYEVHLGKCFGDDFNFDDDDFAQDSSVSMPSKNSIKKEEEENYFDDSLSTTSCSNCGAEVLMAELKLHLQYCVDSDDETDLEGSPCKSTPQKSKQNHPQHYNIDTSLVSCPSCMEKVKEENIQQHLDECLGFICEEF